MPIFASTLKENADTYHLTENGKTEIGKKESNNITAEDVEKAYEKRYGKETSVTLVPSETPQYKIEGFGTLTLKEVRNAFNIGGGTYALYGNVDDFLEVDAKGSLFRNVEFEGKHYSTDEIADIARERGYKGAIIRNVMDKGLGRIGEEIISDTYVFFDPEQVKSADPVTYDDKGNVIPLSERFNAKKKDIRYSRKTGNTFKRTIDSWNGEGRPDGIRFNIGMTGDVLQGLGAIESDIYINSDKVNTILDEHPEMTLEIISKIPEILDGPALILKSNNAVGQTRSNTRVVMFGSVKAENGRPVLVVLDLRPVEKGLVINDMQKVTSAYTKTNSPVEFVRNSEVLYADKKRTLSLLRTIGFQMPIELDRSRFIGSISYRGQNVNIKGEKFADVISDRKKQFSRKTGRSATYHAYEIMDLFSIKQNAENRNVIADTLERLIGAMRDGGDYINDEAIRRFARDTADYILPEVKKKRGSCLSFSVT